MNSRKEKFYPVLNWLVVSLPVGVVVVASFLPLRVVFQQALVGIVLIWLQISLMLRLLPVE